MGLALSHPYASRDDHLLHAGTHIDILTVGRQ